MLKSRLISAFILMPTVVAILFLLPLIAFSTIILIICMLAALEWSQINGFALYFQRIWMIVLCVVLIVIMFCLLSEYNYFNIDKFLIFSILLISLGWWSIALLLVLFYPSSSVIWCHSKVLRFIFGLLTIVPFFCAMIALRSWHYNENHYSGALWLLYVMILVWGMDSGAYFFGKLFGKHKLAPKISPEKTWQGLIGGLFIAIIIFYNYNILIHPEITSLTLLICSAIASLASVLGDLTESMFKREAGMKDSGCLIPGHGGILDRIDGLTAAVPIFSCILYLILYQSSV